MKYVKYWYNSPFYSLKKSLFGIINRLIDQSILYKALATMSIDCCSFIIKLHTCDAWNIYFSFIFDVRTNSFIVKLWCITYTNWFFDDFSRILWSLRTAAGLCNSLMNSMTFGYLLGLNVIQYISCTSIYHHLIHSEWFIMFEKLTFQFNWSF